MKDKILALLIAKFAGVRKDGLAQLATAMSIQAADETEATALVEKISLERVNDFVKDWRKDVDKEVSEATKTHEKNLKTKFEFKEKDKADPDKTDPKQPTDPADIASMITASVTAAMKPIQDKLAGFEGEKVKSTRLQALEGKLKDVPDSFKAQKLKDFGRMTFSTDEEFTEYLTETETDLVTFTQELADKGMSKQTKPILGKTNAEGVSKGAQEYIAASTAKDKPMQGKEV